MLSSRLRRHVAAGARRFSALPKLRPVPQHKTLDVLQATSALLPRVLTDAQQLRLWDGILASALADVQSSQSRPIRLVVWGSNQAAAGDLVTALLEQPFAQNDHLRTRWSTAQPHTTNLILEYPSSLPIPIQLIETRDSALLATADVAIVVAPISEARALNLPRSDLVVLNMDDLGSVETPLRASTSQSPSNSPKYFLVSPSQAAAALQVVQQSPSSSESVQRYQTAFVASRMPQLIQSLNETLASIDSASLQERTALLHTRAALAACRAALETSWVETDRLATAISQLRSQMEEERVRVHLDVLGQADEHIVDRAVQEATAYVKLKIEHMRRWSRSMWTIDEITSTMGQMVQRVWRNDLEKELIYHAGRLQQMQERYTTRAFRLTSLSNTGPLHSPLLENKLKQLAAVPTFAILPSSLSGPLVKRNSSIVEIPTARLHVAGQRALFGMGGAIVTGMTISWTGYLGFFMNTNGLASSIVLEPGTAVATGMLISVLGVHWAARKWNKALKAWLDDFVRVAGGIKQDVSHTLDETMEKQVLVVADAGCVELSKRIDQRQIELKKLQETIDTLLSHVYSLEHKRAK
ncbi:hypothetical protein MIND_01026600 [Mycena indigotica]|uniref:Transmembrane protein n=1 Tax=Mycena indigotica TaxID=2126181 RepID=A0A8H6VUZ6_9AGAR|nr:uncharacterized protein MIND_01026600 [Mycena indigotica]KAF7294887.1 hypothetical protein MIND_01026600 [Mycena indigotica]